MVMFSTSFIMILFKRTVSFLFLTRLLILATLPSVELNKDWMVVELNITTGLTSNMETAMIKKKEIMFLQSFIIEENACCENAK